MARSCSVTCSTHLCEFLHVGGLDVDDVEGLVGDLHVPQVDAEVVGREVRLAVRVDADRVDVVGVRVGEDAPRRRLHHQFHRFQHGNLPRKIGRDFNLRLQETELEEAGVLSIAI